MSLAALTHCHFQWPMGALEPLPAWAEQLGATFVMGRKSVPISIETMIAVFTVKNRVWADIHEDIQEEVRVDARTCMLALEEHPVPLSVGDLNMKDRGQIGKNVYLGQSNLFWPTS